jgi:hypothetical protein
VQVRAMEVGTYVPLGPGNVSDRSNSGAFNLTYALPDMCDVRCCKERTIW